MTLLLPVLLLTAAPAPARDRVVTGRGVSVADGDTLTVLDAGKARYKVRLQRIDAREKAQAFGTKAKQALSALVFGKDVTVTVVDADRYGRSVGKVKQGDTNANRKMVTDGLAWRYPQYDKAGEYTAAESAARTAKRGLRAGPSPTPPWEFRRKKRRGPAGGTPAARSELAVTRNAGGSDGVVRPIHPPATCGSRGSGLRSPRLRPRRGGDPLPSE